MKVRTNLSVMFLTLLTFGGCMIYFVIAFTAQDLAWFLSGFDGVPVRVLVYHEGQKTEYTFGTPGYAELANGVRSSLNQGVARISGTGLSSESLQDAYSKYVSVEAFFEQPVKLHAWFYTGEPTQMLFLITGRHSEESAVFLSSTGNYMSGAPVLKTVQPLLAALASLGYKTQ
jgi:hypothetical protein